MSPRRGPCDGFAQAAALRVDRELGRAEAEKLEAHLEICAPCRVRAHQSEVLSAVLKRWDAEQNDGIRAPARLAMSVRTALQEEGQWRRREARLAYGIRLAAAASVLLVFGAAIVLGLSGVKRYGDEPPVAAAQPPAAPALRTVSLASLPAPASALRHADDPAPLDAFDLEPAVNFRRFDDREAFVEVFADLRARRLHEEVFLASSGETGEWLDLYGNEARLLSMGARAYLEAKRVQLGTSLFDHLARSLGGARAVAVAPGDRPRYGNLPVSVDTGLLVRDFVRLPRDQMRLDAWLGEEQIPPLSGGVHVRVLTDGGIASTGFDGAAQVWDLKLSVTASVTTLREGVGDHLVAVVRDAWRPVFIPAGELIAGGRADRVVTRAVWIPAGRGEERYYDIPCVAVGTPGKSHGETPLPTGKIAGPDLRVLLASGADAAAVRALVDRQVRSMGYTGRDYSLLDAYGASRYGRDGFDLMVNQRARILRFVQARGLVLSDEHGAFDGIELSDLPRAAASRLLARILLGYEVEAMIGRGIEEPATASQPADEEVTPLRVTLLELLGREDTFRTVEAPGTEVRVSRLLPRDSDVAFEAVEREGRTLLLSGLSGR
ncbi:MAG: anti-sigma factor family protein [Planctomycetota bacterium]|jgi:hypothetical protein